MRFIAINDGYDSEEGEDDMAPFRHVINEMYAKDISKKIRSSLYAKMRDGQYIGSFAPYGYRKSETDKHRLVVDEEAAGVVRRIFGWAAEGETTNSIVEKLNCERIPIPLDYRRICEGKENLFRRWTSSGVCKIIRNQVYLGHTLQGKSRKPSFRSGKSYARRKEDWIVSKNTHDPLVSAEIFWRAQRRKQSGDSHEK